MFDLMLLSPGSIPDIPVLQGAVDDKIPEELDPDALDDNYLFVDSVTNQL